MIDDKNFEEGPNILPPEDKKGALMWNDVSDNDLILCREKNIPDVTENPVLCYAVLSSTINHDYLKVSDPNNVKKWDWIESKNYELIEILPPQLPKQE